MTGKGEASSTITFRIPTEAGMDLKEGKDPGLILLMIDISRIR
jgi:hypothetical protein